MISKFLKFKIVIVYQFIIYYYFFDNKIIIHHYPEFKMIIRHKHDGKHFFLFKNNEEATYHKHLINGVYKIFFLKDPLRKSTKL